MHAFAVFHDDPDDGHAVAALPMEDRRAGGGDGLAERDFIASV